MAITTGFSYADINVSVDFSESFADPTLGDPVLANIQPSLFDLDTRFWVVNWECSGSYYAMMPPPE